MRLNRQTRNAMLHTAKDMLIRLEALCQHEYIKIEHYQQQIKESQKRLEDSLEPEYIKTKALIDAMLLKINGVE